MVVVLLVSLVNSTNKEDPPKKDTPHLHVGQLTKVLRVVHMQAVNNGFTNHVLAKQDHDHSKKQQQVQNKVLLIYGLSKTSSAGSSHKVNATIVRYALPDATCRVPSCHPELAMSRNQDPTCTRIKGQGPLNRVWTPPPPKSCEGLRGWANGKMAGKRPQHGETWQVLMKLH